MKFSAKAAPGDFKPVPAGNHIAVLNLIADVGLQPGSGMYPDPKHQVYLRWELPNERITYTKDGQEMEGPMSIGRFYTASMGSKANLRKDLESWRTKNFTDEEAEDFDLANTLGKACMLTVVVSEKGGKSYSNVKGVGALPKGMPAPEAENPLVLYDGKASDLAKLPEWLQKKVAEQIVQESPAPQPDYDGFEDTEIPFG
jgi:hypothetical protein